LKAELGYAWICGKLLHFDNLLILEPRGLIVSESILAYVRERQMREKAA
jgi:hypothetical protein